MTQTKADRTEAAKKAAATRERNKVRAKSQSQGIKAAASRQANAASDSVNDARRAVGSAAIVPLAFPAELSMLAASVRGFIAHPYFVRGDLTAVWLKAS